MTTIKNNSGPLYVDVESGATRTTTRVELYDMGSPAPGSHSASRVAASTVQAPPQQFHVTTQEGYTAADIMPLAKKWAALFPGGQDLDPRVATTLLLVLEHSAAVCALQDKGSRYSPAAAEQAVMALGCLRSLVAHDLFQVQALRAPAGVVACRGGHYPVEAAVRHASSQYSDSALESMQRYHGVDARMEVLRAIMADVAMSMTRSQLDKLVGAAPQMLAPASKPPEAVLLCALSHFHHQRTGTARSAEASYFAVMSPEQVARLSTTFSRSEGSGGITKLGTVALGRAELMVYEATYFSPTTILVGWRNGPDDAGAVWTPYTMLIEDFMDPTDQRAAVSRLVCRQGFHVLDPSFYMTVSLPYTT